MSAGTLTQPIHTTISGFGTPRAVPSGMPSDTSLKVDLLPEDPLSLVILHFELQDSLLLIQWSDLEDKTAICNN